MSSQFDYLIVGGGAAGCVLANRLSENGKKQVLLLEAGLEDSDPFIHMPKGIGKVTRKPHLTWPFEAKSAEGSNSPPKIWLRGKVLGGSSSINGLMYVRGQPADFDELARQSSADWDWEHISTAYKALEGHELGATSTRGANGPLKLSLPNDRHSVLDDLILSAAEQGVPQQQDINEPDDAPKIGYASRTIWRGRRQSAAVAFLRPAQKRANLQIKTGATVSHIIMNGTCAVGVVADGHEIHAHRVILCAGTFGSPAILQRSGIADAHLLRALSIPIVADRPSVGANLTEHGGLMLQWQVKPGLSTNKEYRGWRAVANGIRYYLTRGGPLASATFDVGAAFTTHHSLDRPNAQLLAAPFSLDLRSPSPAVHSEPGIQMVVYPLRPRARGHVRIRSKDPSVLPEVILDHFADPTDRRELVDTVRFVRRLMATNPIARHVVRELRPGPEHDTDDEILAEYRSLVVAAYHAAGTCRMGADPDSVVDPYTRVRGVQKLHVVDLSIAPFVLSGNTFGPVVALAWRAADLIMTLDQTDDQI